MAEDDSLLVRPVAPGDRAPWQRLYAGYADFYKRPLTPERAETVWGWLMAEDHVLEGLVAERAEAPGGLVGLAHYRPMPSPLRGCDIGFLDDLFVAPAARGTRAGEILIGRLVAIAKARGWPLLRWNTADDNYRARTLYDRVAKKTTWNLYEIAVD